jgi:hypothetical protein
MPPDHQVTEPPLLDIELGPGDCLYVPRGFLHSATADVEGSAHLTVGMLTYTWNDVLREVVGQAAEEVSFRESLPIGFARDVDGLKAQIAQRVADLALWLDKFDPDRVAESVVGRFWSLRPPVLTGQLGQLLHLDDLDDGSVVRRRPESVCRLRVRGGQLTVQLGDRELRMPARLEPAMRFVAATGRFTVGDLAGHLDPSSRLVLVRRLIREGLLESVAVG